MRTICCFKHAGMSIEDLKRFFAFEADEPEHIDDIVALLEDRRAAIEAQRRTPKPGAAVHTSVPNRNMPTA